MFRLINAELKKIFMKPLVYIMAIILCVSLIFSLIIFKPETPNYSSNGFTLSGNTIEETKASFSNTKIEIDTNIETIKNYLSSYRLSNNALLLQNYKNTNNKSISDILSEYNTIISKGSAYYGGDSEQLSELNLKLSEINNTFKDLKNQYTLLTDKTIPTIRITNELDKNTLKILNDIIAKTTVPTTPLSITGHTSINDDLKANNYATTLTENFSKLKNVGFTDTEITNLNNLYLGTSYINKQSILEEKIHISSTKDDVMIYAKQYNSNANTVTKIIYLSIYQNTVKDVKDGDISDIKNLTSLNANIGFTSTNVSKYSISNKLVSYQYIFENDLYDYELSFATNGNITLSNKISAFDYCLNALQMCAFVIIIFCVILGATSVSNEINYGTMKIIATKPISRTSIVLAKLLSTFLFALIFTAFSALSAFVIGYFAYGLNTTSILAVFNAKSAFIINPFIYLLIYIGSIILKMFVFVSLSIMLSIITKNNIPSIIISIIAFFIGTLLFSVLPTSNFISYIPFVNLDLFVFFGGCNVGIENNLLSLIFSTIYINGNTLWITLLYLLGLPMIFNIISLIVFNKRDIN